MSELVSNIELKKADGKPITFNFQFENGLPVKPIIETGYTFGFHKKDNVPVYLIYLTELNEKLFKSEDVEEAFYEKKNEGLNMWLVFKSFYILLKNIDLDYKSFYFGIFDSNKNYLKRCLINGS